MAGRQKLELLSLRRQALLLESDLNRLVLRAEFEKLRAAMEDLDGALAAARRFGPWLVPATAVGGLLVARLFRKRFSASTALKCLLRWTPAALSLWRQFRSQQRPSRSEADSPSP